MRKATVIDFSGKKYGLESCNIENKRIYIYICLEGISFMRENRCLCQMENNRKIVDT